MSPGKVIPVILKTLSPYIMQKLWYSNSHYMIAQYPEWHLADVRVTAAECFSHYKPDSYRKYVMIPDERIKFNNIESYVYANSIKKKRKYDDDKVSTINNSLLFQSYGIKYEIYFLPNEMNSIYSSHQHPYLEFERHKRPLSIPTHILHLKW